MRRLMHVLGRLDSEQMQNPVRVPFKLDLKQIRDRSHLAVSANLAARSVFGEQPGMEQPCSRHSKT